MREGCGLCAAEGKRRLLRSREPMRAPAGLMLQQGAALGPAAACSHEQRACNVRSCMGGCLQSTCARSGTVPALLLVLLLPLFLLFPLVNFGLFALVV